MFCNCNSARTFSFARISLIFFLLQFLYRCNLVRTFEEYMDFLLKVQNCKVLPVFCCDDVSKINSSYFCNLYSISSLHSDLFIADKVSLTSLIESQWHASNLFTIIVDVSSREVLVCDEVSFTLVVSSFSKLLVCSFSCFINSRVFSHSVK